MSAPVLDPSAWPRLPLAEWQDTHDTLHMWTQIVGKTRLAPVPREIEAPIPFAEDRRHAAYDGERVQRFFRMLVHADRALARFKGRFLGKCSPVHFFWGAFDLTLTRFSGRRAPEPKTDEWWV